MHEGEFVNNIVYGEGEHTNPDGSYVKGFVQAAQKGSGTFTTSNGDTYVGGWIDLKLSGE